MIDTPETLGSGERLYLRELGGYVRERRNELGHSLESASRELGIGEATLILWESEKRPQSLRSIPRILTYLGYDPFNGSIKLADRLWLERLKLGLSRAALAKRLKMGVDAYERWEDGKISLPRVETRRLLERFLQYGLPEENQEVTERPPAPKAVDAY